MPRFFLSPRLLYPLVAIGLVAFVALASYRLAERAGLAALHESEQHRLDLVALSLEGALARFEYLPSLLEMAPGVMRLLDTPDDPALQEEVNRYLYGINATAGAEMLYVLSRQGVAIATADAHRPGSPLGRDLSFRPYVRDALARGHGRFFGMGVTSGRPGYYLSYALPRQGPQRGIATVKIGLSELEMNWHNLAGEILLADENGVVVMSTRSDWRFRPLAPLSDAARDKFELTRPYGDASLQALDWHDLPRADGGMPLARVEGRHYAVSSRSLENGTWRLLVLDDVAAVRNQARTAALITALAATVLALMALAWWQRRRAIRASLRSQAALQAAHDGLEAEVAKRTAELRATQSELVHAGKMATLGQLSAGMVHELNQPLAALRTLADNTGVLLDHGRERDVRDNLQRIAQLVDRLGRTSQQLKAFAHKSTTPPTPVSVARAIANAQFMLMARLREADVRCAVTVTPPALQAYADDARLEQILVNLIGNAIDALRDQPVREIAVTARAAEGRCLITVDDSGPGIRADILARLFEPFASSKRAGAGLGLGLTLSAHLARDFQGSLSGGNRAEGGARFVVDLPLADTPDLPAMPPPAATPATAPEPDRHA